MPNQTKTNYFTQLIAETPATKQKLFYAGVYLFAQKGYANVGIRELCNQIPVKQSAFYNHYPSKDALFQNILTHFEQISSQVIFTEAEIQAVVAKADITHFLQENMRKFTALSDNPLYHTILQIVLTESFINEQAFHIAKNNLYHLRKGYTERILTLLMQQGSIRPCNVQLVTAEYYYALKGILDELVLLETWQQDLTPIFTRIHQHIHFFATMLAPLPPNPPH